MCRPIQISWRWLAAFVYLAVVATPISSVAQFFGPGPEGTVNFSATHTGANHVGANAGFEILFDSRRPQLTITSPTADASIGGTTVTVSGFVEDEVYSFFPGGDTNVIYQEVFYRLTDALGVVAEGSAPVLDGRFTIPNIDVAVGSLMMTVRAVDGAGLIGNVTRPINVVAEPDIFLVGLEDGQAVTDAEISLDINFTADTTIVAFAGSPDGRFFPAGIAQDVVTVPLSLGANIISFRLNAGQVDYTESFTIFRVDSLTPPQITSIADGDFTNQTSLEITGLVPLGTPLVEVNGIPATIAADGVTFSATIPVQAGINRVTAQSLPSGGFDHVTFRQDLFPPSIFSVTPRDLTTTLAGEAAFAGKANEPVEIVITGPSGSVLVESFELSLPPDPFGFIDTEDRFSAEALPLIAGLNTFQLSVTDRAGNLTVRSFNIENLPPALTLVAPIDGGSTPDLRVSAVFDVLEDLVLDAVYSGGGRIPAFEGLTLLVGQNTLPPIPLGSGSNTIRLVYRRIGGALSESLSFGLTSTADPLTTTTVEGQLTDAATGEVLANSFVAITVGGITQIVVTDENGRYSVEVEPGTVAIVATSETYLPGSFGGTGNPGDTIVADLGLDSTGLPSIMNEVAIVVPPDGTVTDFEFVTVVGTVLDSTSLVDVNGIPADVVGNRFTARSVPLAMGLNTIVATVSRLGLPTVVRAVSVERSDTPVLDVVIYSPPNGATVPGGGLVVRGFVSGKGVATRVVGSTFVTVEEGVFAANDIFLNQGVQFIEAEAEPYDGTPRSTDSIGVNVLQESAAVKLQADPASGVAPLASTLSLSFGESAFDFARIDFDGDGDGILDDVGSPDGESSVTIDTPGRVVARVFLTTPEGVEVTALATLGAFLPASPLTEFAQGNPVDLAPAPNGLYVLDSAAGTVSRYDNAGVLIASIAGTGTGDGQLQSPLALTVGPDGRLFVADTGNNRLQVFSPDGTFERSIGEGVLSGPSGVAVTNDFIVVSDTGNDRIQLFEILSGDPDVALPYAQARGLSALADGSVMTASPIAGLRILIEDSGRFIFEQPRQLDALPTQGSTVPVDVDGAAGNLWIADASANRIVQLDSQFRFIREVDGLSGTPRAVLSGKRRETPSVYIADGSKVVEMALPVPSPIPVLEDLRLRLAAIDIDGALELAHPASRDRFEEMYIAIEPDLPIDAAAMEGFSIDLLTEERAIVIIESSRIVDGQMLVEEYPALMVRVEGGAWFVYDY